ncbi:gcn5-related n-acetyltransferase-like protein [Ophiostoma piceae UAMH 11346]|uniref:Gcn5-related n-acetyltransferase-like protein n=1 Tax=Ophiostoma piceae (strain UAMH 11346) TaxID=1262450 RepID=S3C2Y2_OPHP1|nr:gcn5-related n-acetyltransferase-like protein [Ophiostoma piceae UAMH 11346]
MAKLISPASSMSQLSGDSLLQSAPSLVPAQWQNTVRVIGMSEYREAALSLAHAFATDNLCQYVVTSDDSAGLSAEDKWRLHVDIMTYIVAAVAMNGIVTTIGPDYDGVALWMPPGKEIDGWWTALRSGLWRLHFQLSTECRRRYYAELLPLFNRTKLEVMAERGQMDDSYYLLYLGTKPSARCRGYAQKLLQHMIARADADRRPVYLESSTLANNAYYTRFGFEVKRDLVLTRGPHPIGLSIMVREPQAVSHKTLADV